jgi:parallel beta-helix repeat protein
MKYVSIVIIVVMALLFNTANATIWYVHPDSTLNTIQVALDGCAAGDTVLVGPGWYHEHLVWPNTNGIDLMSEFGCSTGSTANISGSNTGRVITIATGVDTTTVIKGFQICNGYAGLGGGIRCSNGSCPMIVGNCIRDNAADSVGGGISCNDASPVIDSNAITANTSTYYGGGIGLGNASHPTITRNLISDNVAINQHAGGIMSGGVGSVCSPSITDNTITNNTAGGGGGGIMAVQGQATINGNEITNNHASTQGGGITCSGLMGTVLNNTISGNTAILNGGGIRICNGGSPEISFNEISGNNAPAGGGIYCDDLGTTPIIKNNIITACTAVYFGAGIHSEDGASPDIDSCTIRNNTGDGVSNSITSTLSINYCDIYDNTGYAVCNFDQNYTLDAENNWWGHASGPAGFGPGSGDSVSDYVDFDPWLTSPGVEEYEEAAAIVLNIEATPNPFHRYTTIRYTIHDPGYIIHNPTLSIYDASGRLVRTFRTTPYALRNTLSWDGRDDQNKMCGNGTYFVILQADDNTKAEKLMLVR